MNDLVLSPSRFGFILSTRAALAFGIGLLVANRIPEPRRQVLGLTLVALGAATTVPAAMWVFGSRARRAPGYQKPFNSSTARSV